MDISELSRLMLDADVTDDIESHYLVAGLAPDGTTFQITGIKLDNEAQTVWIKVDEN